MAPEFVQRQIDALRKKLLDLSLRNRMLNYRQSKRFGIEVLGEDSASLYSLVVEQSKKMSFVGVPDPPGQKLRPASLFDDDDEVALEAHRTAAVDELNAFLANAALTVDQLDTKLNTKEFESRLQPKLRTILREARIANEELGINTLFLTLGMLEWQEEGAKVCRAPLLFLAVKLEQLANGSVRLIHDGSDIGTNLPLKAKLRELNLRLPEWDDDKGVLTYLSEVESTIVNLGHWVVHRDEVHLDFFNYEEYAMYVDLGGENWPDDKKPWNNADLSAIFGAGYEPGESRVSDTTHLDQVRPVASCHEIFDADSSQTIALVRAAEGFSMVVEGPPGTGKSQTIANIIAEAVAAGKSVLFVSAKRAALDVVKRRLTDADLGPMCLDMHDKMTNRREFYAEIKRTVDRAVALRDEDEKVNRLTELRDNLNAHSSAMNEPLAPFDCTPFEAMCRLARLPKEQVDDRDGRIDFDRLRKFSSREINASLPQVLALQQRLGAVGVPNRHPFWGCQIDYLDPAAKLDLEQDVIVAIKKIGAGQASWDEASKALHIELETCQNNLAVLQECVDRVASAPNVSGLDIKSDGWEANSSKIRTAAEALRTRNAVLKQYRDLVQPSAFTSDLTSIESAFAEFSGKWYRLLSGPFRKANTALEALLKPLAPKESSVRLKLVTELRRYQAADAEVESQTVMILQLFGPHWRGVDTDPLELELLLAWVLEIRAKVKDGPIPSGFLDYFLGGRIDSEVQRFAGIAKQKLEDGFAAYQISAKTLAFPTVRLAEEGLDQILNRAENWRYNLVRLPEFISYSEVRRQVNAKGLEAIVEVADQWELASDRLEQTYLRSYYSGVVREAMQHRPELKTFERLSHEAAISEFRSLDSFKLQYNRARVRIAHQRRLPTFSTATGNLSYLKVQCELQRRHKPIRWAMSLAGEAIQRIKPVFMMSPLSVAIHLPPEMPLFDMVVFDEASQIKPEDALCAIARAKQCIVVGDTRQMPPTNFFDRLVDDDEPDEDEVQEFGAEARKLESVLSLMSAVVQGSVRRPDLRWHYRSVHPALIQPSNEMFYDNRLLVFPSPGNIQAGRQVGLILHHHPETIYEAGSKRRINRLEAQLVANRVYELIRSHPEESLLVAAMNKPQADLIDDELTKLERTDPAVFAVFRQKHPHEPLDVKNLETIQGDERDVVLISVTYGRDASGTIRQQFGPLLQDGGERRLNVLFTRARRRCEVFSNLSADDIRVESLRPGVVALKKYLLFAQSGRLDLSIPSGRDEESPFEEDVSAALRELGFEVHCQVGSEGFRIDLAVIDPLKPGRYLLGIECDGAAYHSARSARDRDKLRQRVLEDRGWRLHRIWSHDWWQDREGEIRRLVESIESAREAPDDDVPIAVADQFQAPVLQEEERPRLVSSVNRPYVQADVGQVFSNEIELNNYVKEVAKVEGPIHHDLLFVRLRDAAGYESAHGRTRTWLDGIIDENLQHLKQFGDAIYAADEQLYLPRDWSDRPAAEKKIELLTEAEIASAIRAVVRTSFGIAESEIPAASVRVLGFRKTEQATKRVQTVLSKMLENTGLVRTSDGTIRLPKTEDRR